ncbi:MAG: hypothetical protein GX241_00695 [Ruminococcaceae bacterium]|nr:hypothetical protein [Oscillospiraceae bacterium]
MRGDLNDRLQRAQVSKGKDKAPTIVVVGVVTLFFGFLFCAIVGTALIVKTIDRFSGNPSESDGGVKSGFEDATAQFDPYQAGGGNTNGYIASMEERDAAAAKFVYGTVDGTSYYSSMSGISFKAPSNWTLTSYASDRVSKISQKDMSASNAENFNQSVTLNYLSLLSNSYSSVDDVINRAKNTATTGVNNQMVDENVTANFGGRSFKGVRYKNVAYNFYTEILVTEVDTYALEIAIKADTEAEIAAIRAMFK